MANQGLNPAILGALLAFKAKAAPCLQSPTDPRQSQAESTRTKRRKAQRAARKKTRRTKK